MTPLRQYRKERRLTLSDVATRVGISESQMSRIERDGTDSLEIAIKLAEMTAGEPADFRRQDTEAPNEAAA